MTTRLSDGARLTARAVVVRLARPKRVAQTRRAEGDTLGRRQAECQKLLPHTRIRHGIIAAAAAAARGGRIRQSSEAGATVAPIGAMRPRVG